METRVRMSTSNSAVSPVIDLERTNMNIIHNLIDSPVDEMINESKSANVTFTRSIKSANLQVGSKVRFTGKDNVMRTATVKEIMLQSNKIEIVGGKELHELSRQSTFEEIDVLIEDISMKTSRDFLKETHRYGTTYAKWISRTFFFENECDGIELRIRAILYNHQDITAYYAPRSVGTVSASTQDTTWIPFNINSVNPDTGNVNPALPDNTVTVKPRNPENVDPRLLNSLEWQTLVWTAQDLAKFEGVSIKIVMRQKNPALSPIIDDMVLLVTE